jgi:hypothetical protein
MPVTVQMIVAGNRAVWLAAQVQYTNTAGERHKKANGARRVMPVQGENQYIIKVVW